MAHKPNRKRRAKKARQKAEREASEVVLPEEARDFVRRRRLHKEFHVSAPYSQVKLAMREKKYVDLMRLCKMMNSLSFLFATLRDNDFDSNASRDVMVRMTGSLLVTSALAETIRTLERHVAKHYSSHPAFEGLAMLLDHPVLEAAKPYLFRVRDKIGFHADPHFVIGGLEIAEATGDFADDDSSVLLEHNTGWDAHSNHYSSADFLAALWSIGRDLPTDEQLKSFHRKLQSRLQQNIPYWEPKPGEREISGLIRRAFQTTNVLCNAIIPATQFLVRSVHSDMGIKAEPGPPSQYSRS